MLKTKRILVGLCAFLCCEVIVSGEVPGKDELISLYEKSLDLVQKAAFTAEANINVIEGMDERPNIFHRVTFCRDGERLASMGFQRITVESGEVVDLTNITRIIKERSIVTLAHGDEPASVYVESDKDMARAKEAVGAGLVAGQITRGLLPGMREGMNLPAILREPDSNVTVRQDMEEVDGRETYMLEYQGKEGRITLWLDPNAAYHPRRVTVHKTGDDLFYGKPLSTFRSQKPELADRQYKEVIDVIDSVEIEEVNGVFMIIGGKMTDTQIFTDGYKLVSACDFRFSDIDLNPDFDALKAFEINVPDGTPVSDADFPGGRFEVRGGKIVTAGLSFDEIDKAFDEGGQ